MDTESSSDRTARWVQQHSQHTYRQRSATSRSHPKPIRQEGMSSQQSSRTDLGGQDNAVGSGGRGYAKQTSTAYAQAGSSHSSRQPPFVDEPLSSHHRRSRSNSTAVPQDYHTPPRLNIPTTLYRNPNLPAFVQGPPGSGYPMSMSAARHPPPHARAMVPTPPSPPVQVPGSLNPKKSRPTVHKRRPSLSGETFEPPAHQIYQYRAAPDFREPRAQGQGDVMRIRGRSASETRRR